MLETIGKAAILIAFIFCGYMLKQGRLFGRQSFQTISTIVFTLTLPAAIIVHLNGMQFDHNLLWISLIAIICNFILVGLGYLSGHGKMEKSFYMLNMSGFNIGNFALPFVSYFFDSSAVLVVCLFDAGNSIMCLGIIYGMASYVYGRNEENILLLLVKTILSSVPVLTYIVMMALAMFSISLPSFIVDFASIPASANTFLSMLMIGVAVQLNIKKDCLLMIAKTISVRLVGAILLAVAIYFLTAFPDDIKRVLMILVFSPIAGMACYYTAKLKQDITLSACINSLQIMISIVVMSLLIVMLS